MNVLLTILEDAVIALGLGILLLDLWTPLERKRQLGYVAIAGVAIILLGSFFMDATTPRFAFGKIYAFDPFSLFFKRFFLVAALGVLLISIDFADRLAAGIGEFYAMILFALAGMMFAASAHDFVLVFVSLELIAVSFYILNSFQRGQLRSLEAGIKYLIIGALSSAFMVYGIALIYGTANTTSFDAIFARPNLTARPLFLAGLFLVLLGLTFKIAAFPFQLWAPDVYQGSPAPATAFLAIGSKAAGFALLLRIFFLAVPGVAPRWSHLWMAIAAVTILYGNLCAIPQRNLKRLLGYSSIANAGYLLLGVVASSRAGSSAILFYLGGYLFALICAFAVISIVSRQSGDEDISMVAGLHSRSPLLAASLALAMISLAGIPPLAGFFGKFLLLKAVLEPAADHPMILALVGIALVGIVISFFYYLGVVRVIYWSPARDESKIEVSPGMKFALAASICGILFLGLFPDPLLNTTDQAANVLRPRSIAITNVKAKTAMHPGHK